MYHCFVRSSVMPLCRPEGPEDPCHQRIQHEVDAVKVDAEDDRRQDDDDRGGIHFLAARPRHAPHFVADFGEEPARPAHPAGHALPRAAAERVVVLRHSGGFHLLFRSRSPLRGDYPPALASSSLHSLALRRLAPFRSPWLFRSRSFLALSASGASLSSLHCAAASSAAPFRSPSCNLPRIVYPVGSQKLAGQEGIEPPTPGFGDRCSAN